MIQFIDRLAIKLVRPGWYRVAQDWRVWSSTLGCVITVREGFVFDGDSVPRIPGVYAFAKGRAEQAACLHDWLYRHQAVCGRRITRKEADVAMLEAMVEEGVARRHRWPIYWAVRAGGRRAWRNHQ